MATYNLKYYIEFTDPGGTLNRAEIYQYSDTTYTLVELEGSGIPIELENPDDEDVQEPFQGSSLTLSFIATSSNTLSDLFTENETAFLVKYLRAGTLKWQGFIIPDGSEQSWVDDVWEIKLDCVDGLGLLKNLAFIDEDTRFNFTGLMSIKDIIVNCLRRTKIPDMYVNTHVDIFYTGLLSTYNSNPSNIDPLASIKVNTERFYPANSDDPMNCEDVLKSTLDEYKASITQRNGEWYIYKTNQLASNQSVVWRRYNYLGVRQTDQAAINHLVTLGTFTGTEVLHHAGANQRLYFEKAYKKLTINYKFGTVVSLNQNSDFSKWDGSYNVLENWTEVGGINAYWEPTGLGIHDAFNTSRLVQSDPVTIAVGDILLYEMIMRRRDQDGNASQPRWSIVLYQTGTANYYRLSYNTNGDGGIFWELNGSYINGFFMRYGDETINWTSPPAPVNGTVRIEIYGDSNNWPMIFKKAALTPGSTNQQLIKGEFHTVTQAGGFSFVPDNKEVFNGDGESNIYVGTTYKTDGSPTSTWHRFGVSESKPVLQIAAEDTMRMYQRQRKKFTGSYYGYFDYFSVVQIGGITGLFMATAMNHNYATNQGEVTLREIIGSELSGMTYVVTDDYGDAIKPVIR